jgi:hypothetical protein
VPESSPLWDIVIKVAVEADEETQARSIAEMLLDEMEVTEYRMSEFVDFDDGTWATEINVDSPEFESVEPNDPLSVLSCLIVNLGPVTWLTKTDTPFDPESARVGQMDWPPGYWALAGRKETLVHPSVRAVLLRARRTRSLWESETI